MVDTSRNRHNRKRRCDSSVWCISKKARTASFTEELRIPSVYTKTIGRDLHGWFRGEGHEKRGSAGVYVKRTAKESQAEKKGFGKEIRVYRHRKNEIEGELEARSVSFGIQNTETSEERRERESVGWLGSLRACVSRSSLCTRREEESVETRASRPREEKEKRGSKRLEIERERRKREAAKYMLHARGCSFAAWPWRDGDNRGYTGYG